MLAGTPRISGPGAGTGTGTIGGSIAKKQVAFGTATDTIGGSANFTYSGDTLTLIDAVGGGTMLLLDGTGQKAQLGGFSNGNSFMIDDVAGTETFDFQTSFTVQNTSVMPSKYLQIMAGIAGVGISIGDINPAANGTLMHIDDGSKSFAITADGHFKYQDVAMNTLLQADPGNSIYSLGDTDGGYSGSYVKIDDGTELAEIVADNGFSYLDTIGNRYISMDVASGIYAFGDLDVIGTYLEFDATNSTFDLNIAGDNALRIHPLSSSYQFGAIAFGNHTYVDIDDSAQVIGLNGTIDATTHRLINLVDPVNPQDGATKSFVESFANGLNWKTVVDVATIAALPLCLYANGAGGVGATLTGATFAPLGVIDGYTPTVGQSILVKDQANPIQNGIFTFTQNGNGTSQSWVLTRRADNNSTALMRYATVGVINNGTQAETGWTQTDNGVGMPIIGTDDITWAEFLNSIYTAGVGLALTTHVFSLNTKLAPMDTLTGNSLKILRVNAGETALEYVTAPTTLVLKTNSVINSSQVLLNLIAGTGISLAEVAGAVTITNTGGGGTATIDTLGAATLHTITDAASITFDGTANGTFQKVTLNVAGATRTLAISNLKIGIPYTFVVTQDGTGGRAITWPAGIKAAYGGGTPPISTAANAVDKYSFIYDGTTIFVDYALDYA